MDGLSGAASVIAVASIAVQLADSVKKLYDFWDSVKHGPQVVQTIKKDLRTLEAVLDEVAFEDHQGLYSTRATRLALETCRAHVESLENIVSPLQLNLTLGGRRSRHWVGLKAAFREDRMTKFRHTLQEAKVTLVLARQNSAL